MSYQSYSDIMGRVLDHYEDAIARCPIDRFVCLALQGSQNYGLDHENSDVDTKLIVTPSFYDIAMNRKPVSTTYVRENDEHIDFKDIRLYMQTFRKQNINFIEVLFTPYIMVNPLYEEQWNRLVEAREDIAHFNICQAVKAMRGVAKEKYFAMEHHYPSRMEWINKYSYDPKQLHHLLRIEEFLVRYLNGESYEACLKPANPDYLVKVKLGLYNLEDARAHANDAIEHIDLLCDDYLNNHPNKSNEDVDFLLDDVQYEIMKIAVEKEIGE